jgi:two-component system chemotaxis sensor kinase CheA
MEQEMTGNGVGLAQLVEQAACCCNMLSPGDLSDAQKLLAILQQIGEAAQGLDGAPAPGVETREVASLQGQTAEASEALRQVLEQDVEDTGKALDVVSTAICALQEIIRRLTEPAPSPGGAQAAPEASAPRDEPCSPPPAEEAAAPAAQGMTISEEDAPLVLDFITEAGEHLETAESALLELENHPDDGELVNKIFRGFHTIKGMAGFLNLSEIQSLAHSAESLLDLARKGQLVLAGANSDVAFEALDALKKMLGWLKSALEAGLPVSAFDALPALLDKLKAAADRKASPEPAPAVEVRTTAENKVVAEDVAVAETGTVTPPATEENDKKLDAILEEPPEGAKPKASGASGAHTAEDKIKVSTTRLDDLINLAGELVIAQLMVAEEVNSGNTCQNDLVRRVAHQSKIVRELQELSMSMRMVPVAGVFQKMVRLARDVSRKAGKQVDFVTIGEETELDRTVVDKIADPLIHMVRNAIDHGVEPAQDRAKVGKKPTGRVELRAFHQAGNIVIELEDDGKGLDKGRIVRKATEQGLLEPGQELSDDEAFKLIFHPGLSTAEKITSVSGRGVGMDVVKKNIEALRGRVDISSIKGKGTVFTIRLPLTLAVIDGQVVRIGEARYIVPINAIVRSLRPAREQISTVQGRGELVLERGELIPLVRLYRLLGVAPSTEDPTEALIVVVEEDGRKCCLMVDDLLAQQQVVIKSLGEALGRVRGVSGGSIMGDGKVTLILDVPGLVQLAQER